MTTVEIRDWSNKSVGSTEVPESVFACEYRGHLVHEAVRNHLASLRAGTHKTLKRGEVSGSGRKPFRQKGTGRARQGGSRPPIHRHGGTAHGPVPRDYSYKMNVKEKKAALRSALSQKLSEGRLLVLRDLGVEPKTGMLVDRIAGLGVEGRALLVDSLENRNLVLASRNHPMMQVADPAHLTVYDIVNSRYVVMSESALMMVSEVLG